jgi:hypothetical protein
VLVAPLAQAQATTQTFNPTGAEQTFTVPAGVTHINVLAIGEAGGGGEVGGAAGGLPAEARGEVSVTPGQTLYVEVAQGTFNGGAAGGGATSKNIGGGASDVRTSPRAAGLSPDTRFIVAGGGGGGGESDASGAPGAGGNAGQPGNNAEPLAGFPTAEGGGAGTLTHGGAGGVGQGNGAAGTLGSGGRGGGNNPSFGGGGAGGYYGGGGGGGGGEIAAGPAGAGGGGGSSLVPAGGSTTLASLGTKPVVQISYTAAPVAPRWAINGKSAGSKHEPAFTLGKI